MPGEVLWPTAAFGAMIVLVFGGLALLRLLPHPKVPRYAILVIGFVLAMNKSVVLSPVLAKIKFLTPSRPSK